MIRGNAGALLCLRQVVLWNRDHYGPDRCILNNPARRLTAEPTRRDGLKYTRYRMPFAPDEVTPEQTQYSLIPVNPVSYSTLSKEHLEERIRQDVAAGCNAYTLSFMPGWGEMWRTYTRLFHDTAAAAGARVVLWMNYICDEGKEFWEIVRKEYARALEHYPKATLFFSDWEFHNVTKDGGGVHCFCPRCKAAFRQFAKLPAATDLADDAIMTQHRKEWLAFREWQDGEIQARITQVAHSLGRQYMTYSWSSNDGFWEACRGKIDVAFVGMPGNSVADQNFQAALDRYAADFRKRSGLGRAIGQRFVFFSDTARHGWKATVLSDDGFVHPPSWKTQVLRVVAALQGGIDLQSSNEFAGGMRYYLGEATRILSEFEPLFLNGERADALAACDHLSYPDVLVLRLGSERLVLLFNETDAAQSVVLRNRDLAPGETATVFGASSRTDSPAEMSVTVPANDVAVVHIK